MKKYLLNPTTLVLILTTVFFFQFNSFIDGIQNNIEEINILTILSFILIFYTPYITLLFIDYYFFKIENKKMKKWLCVFKNVFVILVLLFLGALIYVVNLMKGVLFS